MRQKIEASYTVEAAFILPLVFVILCAIVFLAFRLHDAVMLGQCVWEGAFYGAGQTEEVSEKEISDYVGEHIKDNLLISERGKLSVTQTKNKVSVRMEGTSKSLWFVEGLLGLKQENQIRAEYMVYRPLASEYVRNGMIISNKIKGSWNGKEEENG